VGIDAIRASQVGRKSLPATLRSGGFLGAGRAGSIAPKKCLKRVGASSV